ncbi:MAG: beta-galactosidase, partial [Chloroflexaceae bacterium]|nr:beta-galactosidase [Chloroflexaceae bacterium]
MHYGVDYYPEHESEGRWAEDARLIAAAGFTVVRLAEFAWTRLEPAPGTFNFSWLDRAIELLHAEGLQVVLGTPTAAPPHWLTSAHPEMLVQDEWGHRSAAQSRQFVCLNNADFQAATERIVAAMARRYGRHQAVVGWQIDNEFGCHRTIRCTCPVCQGLFCNWLQTRYGTLEALNTAWGTGFWSREFTSWEQVRLPAPTPTFPNPGHVLDAYRFASERTCAYQQMQLNLLRDYAPKQWVCHNLMAFFDMLDYAALTAPLDLVTWDNYVADGTHWRDTARGHDMMRGFRHRPFWVMESPPGQVNWTRYNPDLRPSEARLRSLQAVAHGADGVVYFHWRAFRGGAEQYHSAILPHDGIPGRAYQEASELGSELARLRPLLAGTTVQPRVAIISDMASFWALQLQPHNAALANPHMYAQPWYAGLNRRNVAVEFCQPTEDLSAYQLVIAPMLHVPTPEMVANLRCYVEGGGRLLLGPRAGFKTPGNRVTDQPLPGLLADLAGVRVAEWAALPPDESRCVRGRLMLASRCYSVNLWRELLELRGASA